MASPVVDPFAPVPLDADGFHHQAALPCGITVQSIRSAMEEFVDFLGFLNTQLKSRNLPRLECFMMQANFSSLVGEFMVRRIPKYHAGIARNRYHNGYPDLVPRGHYPGDAVQRGDVGLEVKASRYFRGWQGHNAEKGWLMVFMFSLDCGPDLPDPETADSQEGEPVPQPSAPAEKLPQPFRFVRVAAAPLEESDWTFSGRSGTSRRTITASVNDHGRQKMLANVIYEG